MADPVVTLAGVQLHPPALDGTGLSLEDDTSSNSSGLDGWYGAPKPKVQYMPRPAATGSYPSPLNYSDIRSLTCSGTMIQATSTALYSAMRTLAAICPDPGVLYPLTVADDLGTLTMMVQRSDVVDLIPIGNTAAKYTIGLTAPDPLRYDLTAVQSPSAALPGSTGGLDWVTTGGLDWVTGGGLTWGTSTTTGVLLVSNPGTAPSWPTITFLGPTDSGTLQTPSANATTGQTIGYSGTLFLNDQLVITTNPANRSAILNGSIDVWGGISIPQWFQVPAGGQVGVAFGGVSTSTTPRMFVSVAPAYV